MVAEIRVTVVDEVNELGETTLFTAAEKEHLNVVKELLHYSTKEGIAMKNQSRFDALRIAASKGHKVIFEVLLDYDPEISKTVSQSNATPLISAATRRYLAVVNNLLSNLAC